MYFFESNFFGFLHFSRIQKIIPLQFFFELIELEKGYRSVFYNFSKLTLDYDRTFFISRTALIHANSPSIATATDYGHEDLAGIFLAL
jgi:hypothetical protein